MGINQFSDKFSRILAYSKDEGKRLSCSSIGPEHLLLGMLREEGSAMLVEQMANSVEKVCGVVCSSAYTFPLIIKDK